MSSQDSASIIFKTQIKTHDAVYQWYLNLTSTVISLYQLQYSSKAHLFLT